jgi:hypothetical protein
MVLSNDTAVFRFSNAICCAFSGQDDMTVPCRVTLNGTVICERYVYSNVQEWMKQKSKLDSIINDYQHRVSVLEVVFEIKSVAFVMVCNCLDSCSFGNFWYRNIIQVVGAI